MKKRHGKAESSSVFQFGSYFDVKQ